MANISGWMIYPVDDVTEFYCRNMLFNRLVSIFRSNAAFHCVSLCIKSKKRTGKEGAEGVRGAVDGGESLGAVGALGQRLAETRQKRSVDAFLLLQRFGHEADVVGRVSGRQRLVEPGPVDGGGAVARPTPRLLRLQSAALAFHFHP